MIEHGTLGMVASRSASVAGVWRFADKAGTMAIITQPYFWDEEAAHAKLEQLVWPDGPVCPHCGASGRIGAVTGKGARTALKFCCHCRKQFRATMGTIFEGSHVPLHKWFQACFLLTATRRGISPHQLHLRLEVTNKTALAMVRRLEMATREVERGGSAGFAGMVPPGSDFAGGPTPAQLGSGDLARGLRRRVRWRAGPSTSSGSPSASQEEPPEPFEAGVGEEEVPWAKAPPGPGRQFRAFVEIARELGYDESGGAFEQMLAQIARYQPPNSTRRRPGLGNSERSAATSGAAPTRRFG
jgi:transposase-like protein